MKPYFLMILVLTAFFTQGCDFNLQQSISVDELVRNPRIHEDTEISVSGDLNEVEDEFKIFGIGAKLVGSNKENVVYLVNYAAKLNFNEKVLAKGFFATLNIPMVGVYLILDAKSVEECNSVTC